ncbi:hypothetical protein C8Q76DRAFT_765954 [Earliella scabrosa]|nr:hypothetical protein C8Q76DRAFT_765954 [Earliella scabrosa]
MRAAISHKFGRDFKLGTQNWLENPLIPGKYHGNPSLSVVVSQYMVSLRRRKTRAGEVIRSARAMDSATMKKLWEVNSSYPQEEELQSRKRKNRDGDGGTTVRRWAGYKIRQMLQTLYIVSMLCLLRYDEALRIMWHQVHLEKDDKCVPIVRLELPFRKTDQTGTKTADFILYPDQQRPWLCPVRAFSTWWTLCIKMGVELKGRVFRARCLYDEIHHSGSNGLSPASFMTCFRRNMLEIGLDPRTYGTHSFRRGGCQHLAMERRWAFREICQWGGWAEDFDNPGTIFRYLLSTVDSPTMARKDFMNPNRKGTDHCGHCGRSCPCA